jgi:two-component system chemotaxis response regulator CheB
VLVDGVAGLVSIVNRGGLAMVQDPADALYPGMPERALQHVPGARVLPVAEMGPAVADLVRQTVDVDVAPEPTPLLALEDGIAANPKGSAGGSNLGAVSGFTCQDCQGTLLEMEPGEARYRCRVGHAWSGDALFAAHGESLERALWTALRTLDEKVTLATRMSQQGRERGNDRLAIRYERLAAESMEAADVLRKHLTSPPLLDSAEATT